MRTARVGVVIALVTAIAATSIGIATAGDSGGAAPPPVVLRAELTLDCVHLSAAAREYAVANGYCVQTISHGVTTFGRVNGVCGDSWINIVPMRSWGGSAWSGWARIFYGVSSNWGRMTGRALVVVWDSADGQNERSWVDAAFMSSTIYTKSGDVNAGRGELSTVLDGYVSLWWGGVCHVSDPRDTKYIT
jgi:hypothetical protein